MNTYIYAGNSALLVVKDNDLNKEYDVKAGDIVLVLYASYKRSDDDREIAIIKSEELYNNFKRNLEYEKNRNSKCCEACSPSDC